MLQKVLSTIRRHEMLPLGTRVMVAVSGGPDSVCLLHILREAGADLAGVAHFNHKLRGEASDGDELFVERLAAEMGLPFHRAEAPREAGNLEQSLRRARRSFFARLVWEGLADRVALGHTLDDQAETVLFRLLRGSGLAGLAGILPVTAEGLIRPLLDVQRVEIEEHLRSRGIAWREDASNRDPKFSRNRIRHDLLPQLVREWNPRIVQNLGHFADLAHEEERWWAGELNTLIPASPEFEIDKVNCLPRSFARRVLRKAIGAARGGLEGIEFEHIEQVLELIGRSEGCGRLSLPGLSVERSFAWVRFVKSDPHAGSQIIPVRAPGTYPSPDGKSLIQIDIIDLPQGSRPYDTLSMECAAGELELRGWRPGDRYRPLGRDRVYKVRELFQQARVPSWKRMVWPILTGKGKILWARDFGVAAEFAAESGRVIRVREAFEGE